MFAEEAMGVFGPLEKRYRMRLSESELHTFAASVVARATRFDRLSPEEAAQELAMRRASCGEAGAPRGTPGGEDASSAASLSPLARLSTELIPRWLQADHAAGGGGSSRAARLQIASDCWEERGVAPREDVEGTGLYAAVCFELEQYKKVAAAVLALLAAGVDLKLSLQPAFLDALQARGLASQRQIDAERSGKEKFLGDAAQRAARLAASESTDLGRSLRRHGAVLFRQEGSAFVTLAEGFNHPAPSLGPRGLDPATGRQRTFETAQQAMAAGLSPRRQRPRPSQRHAEMHCLLQLPSIDDALDAEILVTELADVGPIFGWSEPCGRGCMQFLKKFGVRRVYFTDGQGGIVQRELVHEPALDVPSLTFESTSRLMGDIISERACLDVQEKQARESAALPLLTASELAAQAEQEVALADAQKD
eukprot:TRINITY_DN14432_c0_g1_i3.p1 TRINITY_DN14432_c0_g1~~TRINITY_DN14432_c0_g1_i3.p1  ORF type:complete len:423 (-),score=67.27 TRINITY_DN14432_c0_g1_i3:565-1833(-)